VVLGIDQAAQIPQARAAGGEAVKPLTRYALEGYVQGRHERHEMTADPGGKWYAKDEADARIAELEAELAAARAELDRKRVLRNSDQTRSRCKHYAITLAEIALNGDKNAEAAFRAVMPLLSGSSVSRTKVKEAARIASGGVFGNGDSAYTDAAIDAARSKP
jgi:uncharacterized small protein (DUF1192 family)